MKPTRDPIPAYIPPFDLYLFGRGEHWDIYKVLGAHPDFEGDEAGYRFAVWAPNAAYVWVVGDFNDWAVGQTQLFPVGTSGIWAAFVPGVRKGDKYKFTIESREGHQVQKTDPYAFATELRPGTAAVAWDLDNHAWNDEEWMERRKSGFTPLAEAMSIYECHAGSWRRKEADASGWRPYLTWSELAAELIPYVKDLGFTHIEFMPLSEHPLDDSWGYQVGHFFAPTSRFGSPEEFKFFVDQAHQAGIGILLDWVPGHFPKDEWSLGRFDGTALYEHLDPRLGEHPDWGTYVFNYGRHEVRNFLLANALYWFKEFHIDGMRLDAVASMLYLDYSRKQGEWVPNIYGGNENLDAVHFLQELNRVVHAQFPGAIMIAEESTSWAGVSRPTYVGGLGFTFKWNMGWMHDTLLYFSKEPVHRGFHHNNLTFSMLYAFTENFILPISHDEVVHGKLSLISKMPGDNWQKFANTRAFLAYLWAHPGKKLLFMGQEFGQWTEWNCNTALDWPLLDFDTHQGVRRLIQALNWTLRSEPAMHEADHDWAGFEWMDFSDYRASVISFLRKDRNGGKVLWVFNFTPVVRHGYRIPCPQAGRWVELVNTDDHRFGGSGIVNPDGVEAHASPTGGAFLELTLPPLAGMAFKPL